MKNTAIIQVLRKSRTVKKLSFEIKIYRNQKIYRREKRIVLTLIKSLRIKNLLLIKKREAMTIFTTKIKTENVRTPKLYKIKKSAA